MSGDHEPVLDGDTVRFGVTDARIEFVDTRVAEMVCDLLSALGITTEQELDSLELPPRRDALRELFEQYEAAGQTVEEAPERAAEVERAYNDAVYDVYGLSDDVESLIRERVVKPANPLEPRETDGD